MNDSRPSLILASTSPYRRLLLERLGLPFQVVAPEVEETPRPGESGEALSRRLCESKARAVARHFPQAVVIGADQVAVVGDTLLGKPGHRQGAMAQLRDLSGRTALFWTGLCLCHQASDCCQVAMVPFEVVFRTLRAEEIEGYVDRDQPFDCAGSFRAEGLGIALFQELRGTDPTALMGLPLITLTRMLATFGLPVL